jgi:hypothetical protein
MHDRRYHDAGGAPFTPILDPDSANLDHRDSFGRIFSLMRRAVLTFLPRVESRLATQPPSSLDRI